jgi:hypothetical protein
LPTAPKYPHVVRRAQDLLSRVADTSDGY